MNIERKHTRAIAKVEYHNGVKWFINGTPLDIACLVELGAEFTKRSLDLAASRRSEGDSRPEFAFFTIKPGAILDDLLDKNPHGY